MHGFELNCVTGFIATYIAPLAFVLFVTMGKEAYDDYKRHLRDQEANSMKYLVLSPPPSTRSYNHATHSPHPSLAGDTTRNALLSNYSTRAVPSSSLRVGDLVLLEKNQRVPADLILLKTSDVSGTCFIRTDQLDGETDWKLRVAVGSTKGLGDAELVSIEGEVYADAPIKDLNTFIGTFTVTSPPASTTPSPHSSNPIPLVAPPAIEPLTADNLLWSNTVLAAGSAVGFVIYTGSETRAVMNTSHPETKVGLLDLEVNRLAKVSFSSFLFASHSFHETQTTNIENRSYVP